MTADNERDQRPDANANQSHFSYLSLTDSGGRHFRWKSYLAAFFLGLVLLLPTLRRMSDSESTLWDWIIGPGPGLILGYIAWQSWKFISSRDELDRRLHIESIAVAHLISLAIAGILLGLSFMDCCSRIPATIYASFWIITAWGLPEAVHAVLRRRYE